MQNQTSENYVKLMLDSGAYSARNFGEEINIYDYIDYVKVHKHLVECYINLDVLPGEFGQKKTQKQLEYSAAKSYENLEIMRDAGLMPIPVFHMGEDFKWLEKMVEDGYPYVGIGSGTDTLPKRAMKWLDKVFSAICDSKGRPYVRTHGFGTTNPVLLKNYPWYSTDSTTWSLHAGFGSIYIPPFRDGKFDYTEKPNSYVLSGILQKNEKSQKMQFDAVGPSYQDLILKYLKEEIGVSIEQARYDSHIRRRCLLRYYQRMEETIEALPYNRKSMSFNLNISERRGISPPKTKIIFASSAKNGAFNILMTDLGIQNRLLSYFELKDRSDDFLEHYIKTGKVPIYRPRRPASKWDLEAYRNFRRFKLLGRVGDNNATDRTS